MSPRATDTGDTRNTRAAVFLDRDGVLIANVFYEDSRSWEAPRKPDRCELYAWTVEALLLLQGMGYALIVISNQPNVALGKSSALEFAAVREEMERGLREWGIVLSGSYYCFHHPFAQSPSLRVCECRKPSPRMVWDAASALGIDLRRSWMVGDRDTDVECGKRAGVRTIRVASNHHQEHPATLENIADAHAENLLEASRLILQDAATMRYQSLEPPVSKEWMW